jgi:hypothetical protein
MGPGYLQSAQDTCNRPGILAMGGSLRLRESPGPPREDWNSKSGNFSLSLAYCYYN